jgi:hypothetical protein
MRRGRRRRHTASLAGAWWMRRGRRRRHTASLAARALSTLRHLLCMGHKRSASTIQTQPTRPIR